MAGDKAVRFKETRELIVESISNSSSEGPGMQSNTASLVEMKCVECVFEYSEAHQQSNGGRRQLVDRLRAPFRAIDAC